MIEMIKWNDPKSTLLCGWQSRVWVKRASRSPLRVERVIRYLCGSETWTQTGWPPGVRQTFTRCCFNAGPATPSLAQHSSSIGSSCVLACLLVEHPEGLVFVRRMCGQQLVLVCIPPGINMMKEQKKFHSRVRPMLTRNKITRNNWMIILCTN